MKNHIEILGARENNLKNIDLKFKKNNLIVITGVSGSGKSSLAFNTIYAEGQRRYMESFSAYARSFIGEIQRPDLDKINGLSPVISIEQKTTSKNPRSTVGTLTEIYDFLRLLYARASIAYSYLSGKRMIKQNKEQIINSVKKDFLNKTVSILAPVVKSRKGHYKELFQKIRKKGFANVRIDGKIVEITKNLQLDRYSIHDIEIVVDKLEIEENNNQRLLNSISIALKSGDGTMYILDNNNSNFYSKNLVDPSTGLSFNDPSPNSFSFNSPYGWCESCKGLGIVDEVLKDLIIEDYDKSISRGGIIPLGPYKDVWIFKKIQSILKKHKLDISSPIKEIPEKILDIILYGDDHDVAVNSKKYPGTLWYVKYHGVIDFMKKSKDVKSKKIQEFMNDFFLKKKCSVCNGDRLKKESLHFKINNKNISELNQMDIKTFSSWLNNAEKKLNGEQKIIAKPIFKEISQRIEFLLNLGLTYLSLDRPLKSLSGGEAQRIRLATQIGTQLVGVLYILDEPSIGLHQRDNTRLIQSLESLRDIGNSVIVVEHDRDMIERADHVIDIGPKAGKHGGEIISEGKPSELKKHNTLTAGYITGAREIAVPEKRREGNGKKIVLSGCTGNNLKNVTVEFPLGKMIGVTGVSGSGKSTLIVNTLYDALNLTLNNNKSRKLPKPFKSYKGVERIDKIIDIDQSPIGRTPRSNPATYTGAFGPIRDWFANLPESKARGYKVGRFSFNVRGGRCESCEGDGVITYEMHFLPDVYIACDVCKGSRYNRETLEIKFKNKNIADVLNMTVDEGCDFFVNIPAVRTKLLTLKKVGLGYIKIGQQATTLSGGEAQRIKLAKELSKRSTGRTMYILDEPTTGLHAHDIKKLLEILQTFVVQGNTVVVIEHNLDVIKTADWIIDMGPEGGVNGGQIIAEGSPEKVTEINGSYTGDFLKNIINSKFKKIA